jgi:preprotein translocase subunit SecB
LDGVVKKHVHFRASGSPRVLSEKFHHARNIEVRVAIDMNLSERSFMTKLRIESAVQQFWASAYHKWFAVRYTVIIER